MQLATHTKTHARHLKTSHRTDSFFSFLWIQRQNWNAHTLALGPSQMPEAHFFHSTIYCGGLIYELFQAAVIMCSEWGGPGISNQEGFSETGWNVIQEEAGVAPNLCCLPPSEAFVSLDRMGVRLSKAHFAWGISFIRVQGETYCSPELLQHIRKEKTALVWGTLK